MNYKNIATGFLVGMNSTLFHVFAGNNENYNFKTNVLFFITGNLFYHYSNNIITNSNTDTLKLIVSILSVYQFFSFIGFFQLRHTLLSLENDVSFCKKTIIYYKSNNCNTNTEDYFEDNEDENNES